MHYDFDHCPDRRQTDSIKWRAYDEDVLPLWVADMDFVSPEPVIRALAERVQHGVFGYPTSTVPGEKGAAGLRAAVAGWLERRHHWRVDPSAIVFLPGVITGFNLAGHMQARAGAGEPGPAAARQAVLIQTPVYPPFLGAARQAGMERQEMELTRLPDGSYTIDMAAFDAAITPETRLFILCNPHNPVGRVFRRDELLQMAEICLRHGVTICSDEIHADLVFPGHPHLPLASLDEEIAQHTITLMAPSKTFNLAGLECSFAVIPNPELRARYLASGKGLLGWVNLMGATAAEAAYCEGDDWLDQLLVYLACNRDFLVDFVRRELPGVTMHSPEGTYLAWLDCRAAGLGSNPAEFFLQQARVALNDGATFGRGGEGFVRLNFGCPQATLAEALVRMRRALLLK